MSVIRLEKIKVSAIRVGKKIFAKGKYPSPGKDQLARVKAKTN